MEGACSAWLRGISDSITQAVPTVGAYVNRHSHVTNWLRYQRIGSHVVSWSRKRRSQWSSKVIQEESAQLKTSREYTNTTNNDVSGGPATCT